MKLKSTLIYKEWRAYFVAFFVYSASLQNLEVSAVTHKKSPSKSSLSSFNSPVSGKPTMMRASPGKGIPGRILSEIRSLDNQLLCFPKLLCTIYQDDSITKRHALLNATELGVAYIKLLRAVHYMSPTESTTIPPAKVKQPIIQIFQIPSGFIQSSTYTGRKDHLHSDDWEDYTHHLRSPLVKVDHHDEDNDDDDGGGDEYNLDPPRSLGDGDEEDNEYLRERLEISQMMQDLKEDDDAEYAKDEPSSGGIVSTLVNSFLPFMGSRALQGGSSWRKDFIQKDRKKKVQIITRNRSMKQIIQLDDPQDPFWKAVNLWKKLKSRTECREIYKTCPFEAWEIVRMLDLVNGQSKVLSAYLKITVDNVKPASIRN